MENALLPPFIPNAQLIEQFLNVNVQGQRMVVGHVPQLPNEGVLITFHFACHICQNVLASVANLRNHILRRHRIELPQYVRGGDIRAPLHENDIVVLRGQPYNLVRYRCPLCVFSFLELPLVANHLNDVHNLIPPNPQ